MLPRFWKLSQGTGFFELKDLFTAIDKKLVYLHRSTRAMAGGNRSQASDFINATTGDYFYLTHGNSGVYLLGQFVGPANLFSEMKGGWLDRPFRLIKLANTAATYDTEVRKWWTPNFNSSFVTVPQSELRLFEKVILAPFFDITLAEFGVGDDELDDL